MAKAKSTCLLSVAALHLVAVLVVITTSGAAVASASAVLDDSFDVARSTAGGYASFLADFDYHVATTASRKIKNHPLLARQQVETAPPAWLRIHLTGGSGGRQASATLLIRSDNLYLCGFCNKDAGCFAFLGDERKIPGSAPLSFGGKYRDLFGKSAYRGLDSLVIGKEKAQSHLDKLASFLGGDDLHLKKPLAFFVLTICEAERFVQIRDKVTKLWTTKGGGSINDMRITRLVVNWREISCPILAWDREGQTQPAWDRNQEAQNIKYLFGIKDAADALSRVQPILQTTRCSRT